MKKQIVPTVLASLAVAAVLFALRFGLQGVSAAAERKVLQHTLQTMLPRSSTFTEEVYRGEDTNVVRAWRGETGCVVEVKTYGYAGDLTMLVGVSNEGEVVGVLVKAMRETPGLGGKALRDWQFLGQFLRTAGNVAIRSHDGDVYSAATDSGGAAEVYVDAIAGATVTSKAVARCVNSAVGYVTGADVSSGATVWEGEQ